MALQFSLLQLLLATLIPLLVCLFTISPYGTLYLFRTSTVRVSQVKVTDPNPIEPDDVNSLWSLHPTTEIKMRYYGLWRITEWHIDAWQGVRDERAVSFDEAVDIDRKEDDIYQQDQLQDVQWQEPKPLDPMDDIGRFRHHVETERLVHEARWVAVFAVFATIGVLVSLLSLFMIQKTRAEHVRQTAAGTYTAASTRDVSPEPLNRRGSGLALHGTRRWTMILHWTLGLTLLFLTVSLIASLIGGAGHVEWVRVEGPSRLSLGDAGGLIWLLGIALVLAFMTAIQQGILYTVYRRVDELPK